MEESTQRTTQNRYSAGASTISHLSSTQRCRTPRVLCDTRTTLRTLLVAIYVSGHSLVRPDLSRLPAPENSANLNPTYRRGPRATIRESLYGHYASHTVRRIQIYRPGALLAHTLARMGHAPQRNRKNNRAPFVKA